jgi:hypothetical protein
MDAKKCNLCNLVQEIDNFSWKNKNKNTRSSKCKSCHKEYVKTHYINNCKLYKDKAYKSNKKYRKRNKQYVTELKTVPCMDCGNSYDPVCMDFDHLRDKKTNIANLVKESYSLARLNKEIEKCEVVCANCHRLRTKNRRNGVVC